MSRQSDWRASLRCLYVAGVMSLALTVVGTPILAQTVHPPLQGVLKVTIDARLVNEPVVAITPVPVFAPMSVAARRLDWVPAPLGSAPRPFALTVTLDRPSERIVSIGPQSSMAASVSPRLDEPLVTINPHPTR